ncbi:MAG TPA: SHOCT domain-containing protein [Solirubrobacterales bacterium]|nr:SHOCT domain-containing protein [Solirubrobacterales bacterium]
MSRGRRRTVKALVAVGSVLAFLSVFAIWIERQALDTNDWVHTSDRLIQNEKIRAAVADYLVEQLYDNVNVEKEIRGVLGFLPKTEQLSGLASGALRQAAPQLAEKALETSTAQGLWEDANRTAHEQLLAVLEDKKEAVSTANGEVSLNLGSLVTNFAEQIGIGGSLASKLPPDVAKVTILRSDQLQTAQSIVVAVKGLAILLSLLAIFLFGLAIYLSRGERWVTALFCGIGLVVAGFAVIVARKVAGGIVIDQLVTDDSIKPAGEAAWSISTSLMTSIAVTVILVGAFFCLAGWLASPTSSALATRRVLAPPLRQFPAYIYAGLALLFCIYFLSAPTQNLRAFLTTLAFAAFAAFGVHELRNQTAEEFPDAQFGDVFGRTKDRVVGAVKGANIPERAAKLRLPEVRKPTGQASEAPTATLATDEEETRLSRLERLATLREKGVLTEEELAAEKAKVLGGEAGKDS